MQRFTAGAGFSNIFGKFRLHYYEFSKFRDEYS